MPGILTIAFAVLLVEVAIDACKAVGHGFDPPERLALIARAATCGYAAYGLWWLL